MGGRVGSAAAVDGPDAAAAAAAVVTDGGCGGRGAGRDAGRDAGRVARGGVAHTGWVAVNGPKSLQTQSCENMQLSACLGGRDSSVTRYWALGTSYFYGVGATYNIRKHVSGPGLGGAGPDTAIYRR
ncbi:hypothetical protein UVI_02012590 [Ustilaginoidea virens]|uniref:Uncharacterized protein n=1 Tax=Ustilaginoidea virens TaxID=1159556 RepID=A0A1B5KZT2_USTVR|nr:hypothetical protein UVI_02012590 [Ustilaginoidea virens]